MTFKVPDYEIHNVCHARDSWCEMPKLLEQVSDEAKQAYRELFVGGHRALGGDRLPDEYLELYEMNLIWVHSKHPGFKVGIVDK